MSNPRKNVQDMIRRRQEKNKKIREEVAANRTDPEARIQRFLSDMDDSLREAIDTVDKIELIDVESKRLLSDLRSSDLECGIKLEWFGDDEASLRLEGVRVTWGEKYRKENDLQEEIVYDFTYFMLR